MTREDIMLELRGMAEDFSPSSLIKKRIEELHLAVFGRRFVSTSCRNCYHDAIMLMYNHLRKGNPMAKEREFILKRGVLIQPTFGVPKFYTALTITDDVARAYLKAHPEDVKLFEKVGSLGEPQEAPVGEEKPAEGAVVEQKEEKPAESEERAKNRNNKKKK